MPLVKTCETRLVQGVKELKQHLRRLVLIHAMRKSEFENSRNSDNDYNCKKHAEGPPCAFGVVEF